MLYVIIIDNIQYMSLCVLINLTGFTKKKPEELRS